MAYFWDDFPLPFPLPFADGASGILSVTYFIVTSLGAVSLFLPFVSFFSLLVL